MCLLGTLTIWNLRLLTCKPSFTKKYTRLLNWIWRRAVPEKWHIYQQFWPGNSHDRMSKEGVRRQLKPLLISDFVPWHLRGVSSIIPIYVIPFRYPYGICRDPTEILQIRDSCCFISTMLGNPWDLLNYFKVLQVCMVLITATLAPKLTIVSAYRIGRPIQPHCGLTYKIFCYSYVRTYLGYRHNLKYHSLFLDHK